LEFPNAVITSYGVGNIILFFVKKWPGNLKARDHSKNLGAERRIITKRILGKYGGMVWTGFIWLRLGARGGIL
jgi:hypothetical protein